MAFARPPVAPTEPWVAPVWRRIARPACRARVLSSGSPPPAAAVGCQERTRWAKFRSRAHGRIDLRLRSPPVPSNGSESAPPARLPCRRTHRVPELLFLVVARTARRSCPIVWQMRFVYFSTSHSSSEVSVCVSESSMCCVVCSSPCRCDTVFACSLWLCNGTRASGSDTVVALPGLARIQRVHSLVFVANNSPLASF